MDPIKFREIKKEIRIIGIDDAPFVPKTEGSTRVFGVVLRGCLWVEGVLQTSIEIDGDDCTDKINEMITKSPHYGQLRVIMLAGITFGGFNIVDINRLFEETKLPIIVVIERPPDLQAIKVALKHTVNWEKRWEIIQKSGPIHEYHTKKKVKNPVYFQIKGLELKDAQQILKISAGVSHIPEPVRVAHLIGRSFLNNG